MIPSIVLLWPLPCLNACCCFFQIWIRVFFVCICVVFIFAPLTALIPVLHAYGAKQRPFTCLSNRHCFCERLILERQTIAQKSYFQYSRLAAGIVLEAVKKTQRECVIVIFHVLLFTTTSSILQHQLISLTD